MSPKEVTEALELTTKLKDKIWFVAPSCATTGEGLFEGLVRSLALLSSISANPLQAWLSSNIKAPPAGTVKK